MNGVKFFRSMDKKIAAKKFIELLGIVEKLRGPDGCPWDKEQTHQSLLQYFLEETYEVIESVDEKNWFSLEEELYFHERDEFDNYKIDSNYSFFTDYELRLSYLKTPSFKEMKISFNNHF